MNNNQKDLLKSSDNLDTEICKIIELNIKNLFRKYSE